MGLEPTSGECAATCFQDRPLIRPDGFREDLQAEFRGLESNQRPPRSERGVTTTSNCPGFGKEDSNPHHLIQSQGAYRLADSRVRPAGVEPACPVWKTGASAARPRAHTHEAEGEGVEPPRLIARPLSRRVPSTTRPPLRGCGLGRPARDTSFCDFCSRCQWEAHDEA